MCALALAALTGLLATASITQAGQETASRESANLVQAQDRTPDFLFGRPNAALGLRGQWLLARAESDIFAFVTEQLTLEKRDFDAPGVIFDVGVPLNSRLSALGGFEFGRARAMSEDRRFVELGDLPIQQETTLRQADIFGSLEVALLPRGREIGQYAWITAAATPYVGAGAGFLWYRFEQQGDFVDSLDPELPIFSAVLSSDGWTVSRHVFAGVDVRIARQLLISTEARYLWADTAMSEDFVGFEQIDLTGLRITAGIQFVF